jgi:flagellin FlaB
MKSNARNDIQEDKIAAIGIGAMIVFIALILVAAVAAAVIIQTAEKLQQNAQKTGDDTADNMAGKIMIMQGNVANGGTGGLAVHTALESYLFMVRLAPGSETTALNSITYQLFCANGVTEGTMGTTNEGYAAAMTDHTTAITSMTPGLGYMFWIDGEVGDDCSPDSGDTSVELYLHVSSGGTTFETLTIDQTTGGSVVV